MKKLVAILASAAAALSISHAKVVTYNLTAQLEFVDGVIPANTSLGALSGLSEFEATFSYDTNAVGSPLTGVPGALQFPGGGTFSFVGLAAPAPVGVTTFLGDEIPNADGSVGDTFSLTAFYTTPTGAITDLLVIDFRDLGPGSDFANGGVFPDELDLGMLEIAGIVIFHDDAAGNTVATSVYSITSLTQPVPVPGAILLFGTVAAGWIGQRRLRR